MNFTKEQQNVIETMDRNLLVAAAAGSGKTAVLVARIINIITNPQKPIDVDHLLVVTFTKAAASEMRERIENAIQEKLSENPEDEHLQKQSTLIHSANIMTIDSFCSEVLRNNFNEINLDPSFRVADEGELKLIKADVMAETLEECYAKKEEHFLNFIESYSTKKSDADIESAILQLYGFAQSKPFPEKWLKECVKNYEIQNMNEFMEKDFIKIVWENIQETLEEAMQYVNINVSISRSENGPYMYETAVQADYESVNYLLNCKDMNELYRGFCMLSYEALSRKSDPAVDQDKRQLVKANREELKKVLGGIKEKYFFDSPEQLMKDMISCKENVVELISLTIAFAKAYSKAKRDKNVVDFSDIEHLALQVLLEEQNGKMVPSKVALDYSNYFHEIMIDEYQDSNLVQEYLLTSISKESLAKKNLFMVGDVKQSIYKFRLARPELFMHKYDTYSQDLENARECKIDLHKNFRSRQEVIDTVNFFFYQIMGKKVGNIEYDDAQALYYGANYIETKVEENPYLTEICLIEEDPDKQLDKKELEAKAVAQKIKQLKGSFQVENKKTGEIRKAEYSDIVILLRSLSGWEEVFTRVLTQEGIPSHVTSKTGYFSTKEIQSILNYIRVLDNPIDDIALASVLKSYFGGFTDEELARIRCVLEKGKLFDALHESSKQEWIGEVITEQLSNKIGHFLNKIKYFRAMVPYTAIHELLSAIILEFRYDSYVGVLPAGEKRQANLRMLLEKAADFEKTSYKGLFHFVRYMEQLQKYDIDYGEASLIGEHENTVRIMSIHKSKGLEFPICFLCSTSKKFNTSDTKQRMILDSEEGIGIDFVEAKLRIKETTLVKKALVQKQIIENIGEELRVLYVALTRAEEKLIITGTVSDIENEEGSAKGFEKKIRDLYGKTSQCQELTLNSFLIGGASSFLDFLLPAMVRSRSFKEVLWRYGLESFPENPVYSIPSPIKVEIITLEKIVQNEMISQINEENRYQVLQNLDVNQVYDKNLEEHLAQNFAYSYPYIHSENVPTKVSVSELKLKHMEETQEVISIISNYEEELMMPKFMQGTEANEIKGSTRGTAYHKVMELLELEKCVDEVSVKEEMKRFVEESRMTAEESAMVNGLAITSFVNSDLARRMREASKRNQLFREQPFVLGRPACEVKEEYPKEEVILIQGIIDVYFEEADGLVVADYKTDRVNHEQELVERYSVQLDYYAKALCQLTGKKVKEKIIYSFALKKEIVLK
ncbi:MAG: helicase-exonuclease AddAB subunit AddA [Lachnospiraceae bacterium]|nr:helicase-exonuclease AddAB subunit AddA [Lachnospiraceae bacterium]